MTDLAASEPDLTAAEYVLGVLDARERAMAEARLAADPAFADEVEVWNARLSPLAEAVVPVVPPATAWARIALATGVGAVGGAPSAANDDARVRFWRRWAMGASGLAAASLALAAMLAGRPATVVQVPGRAPVAPPPVVATLKATGGAVALVAAYDSGANTLVLAPVGAAPDRTVPTLWLLKRGGGVQRLGPMDMTKPTRISVDPAIAPTARGASGLAVSLEPFGVTSQTPKGPVIASGLFAKV